MQFAYCSFSLSFLTRQIDHNLDKEKGYKELRAKANEKKGIFTTAHSNSKFPNDRKKLKKTSKSRDKNRKVSKNKQRNAKTKREKYLK